MRTRKFSIILAVSLVALVVAPAQALPMAQLDPVGVTISYPSSLTDESGQPVADGVYAFTFALYADRLGGQPLWVETQEQIAVTNGTFVVLLGSVQALPKEVLEGKERWLEVAVRGPGEAGFTLLAPRQELSAVASLAPAETMAPTALSCVHTHLGEAWPSSGTYSNNSYAMQVENSGTGDGIRSYAHATASNFAAFYGVNTGAGTGVYGSSTTGRGVYGNSGSNAGVYGYSGTNDGVAGETSTAAKSGVYGNNTGSGYGLYGRSATGFGVGVAGGGDSSGTDTIGDLTLDGARGEVFAPGNYLNFYSNGNINFDLDNNNNDSNSCFQMWDGTEVLRGQWCENGTKSAVLQTESYGQRAVYTVESPEVWLEDFGSASLVNGEVTVGFEAIFAEMINRQMDYHVVVTPVCQKPVVLFVTAKTAAGFTVKGVTLDNQPSDCAFDYHVVAKRLGLETLRLETVSKSK